MFYSNKSVSSILFYFVGWKNLFSISPYTTSPLIQPNIVPPYHLLLYFWKQEKEYLYFYYYLFS